MGRRGFEGNLKDIYLHESWLILCGLSSFVIKARHTYLHSYKVWFAAVCFDTALNIFWLDIEDRIGFGLALRVYIKKTVIGFMG